MNTINIIKALEKTGKEYYTPADMGKITGLSGQALRVRLSRLKKAGVIERLGRGMYAPAGAAVDPEKAANEAVYPSYVSFRSALSKYGVISEVPYELEMATTKSTRRRRIGNIDVFYRKLKKALFFGYTLEKGVFIAEPEKAFLDLLYLKGTGKDRGRELEKADLSKLERKKIMLYSAKFPKKIMSAAKYALAKKQGRA